MKKLLVCAFVALSGCASGPLPAAVVVQNEAMPAVASALEAVKAAWKTMCVEPAPELVEKCADAKKAVNKAVDVYSTANDTLKGVQ